jgi:hypothetical protein
VFAKGLPARSVDIDSNGEIDTEYVPVGAARYGIATATDDSA